MFAWARAVDPSESLTSGVWTGDWSQEEASPTARLQLGESDVVSFHSYTGAVDAAKRIAPLVPLGRPLLCTESMARPIGSRFAPDLGDFRGRRIGADNWGFVDGRSQTIYPSNSWQKPSATEPPVWFHDIFRRDGTPCIAAEVDSIRSITGAKAR